MKRLLLLIAILGAVLYGPRLLAAEHEAAAISVGFFQQWPTPSQFAQEKKTFDSVLGRAVNWIPFASASEMRTAMASGRIQIAYALGHVPFLVGVSSGLDLTMIGIAVGYPENDNCIVSDAAAITRANARELEGKKVALRPGSVSHYKMLEVLKHLRVDPERVEIVASASGAEAASALRRGEVAMACASGRALAAMSDIGKPLMSGAEQEKIGLKLFDVIAVSSDFMNENAYTVQSFMDVVEASNKQWKINPEPMQAAIARAAAMDQDGVDRALAGFSFPSAAEQKSETWLGGAVPAYSKAIADFFVDQGRLGEALDSYAPFISTRFLR